MNENSQYPAAANPSSLTQIPNPKSQIPNPLSALRRVALLAALVAIVGCGSSEDGAGEGGPNDAGPSSDEGKSVIGMSQCNLGEPWRVQMNADIKTAAEKHSELKVVFKDAQNDALRQRAHVEEFISAGVDLIIISPKEAVPLTEPVGKAIDAGIPVIVLDRAIVGDKYTCFIGADNKKIGEAAGRWLVEKLGGKGKVVELKGLMTSTPGEDRHNGFRAALKDHPDIRVVFEAEMQWLEPSARKEMESALARLSDIDAVYAHNDPGAHGAYLAAQDAGREKDTLFIGIDALPQEGLPYIRMGILSASFEYPTCGKEAIDAAVKILAGQEVAKNIELKSRLFTPANVEQGGQPID